MDWMERAGCRDKDPDLFFPGPTGFLSPREIEIAKAICGRCEVRLPCLQLALGTPDTAGVWGGTTEEERRDLHRARRREHLRNPRSTVAQLVR